MLYTYYHRIHEILSFLPVMSCLLFQSAFYIEEKYCTIGCVNKQCILSLENQRDNLHGSWFVPKIRTRRSYTNSTRSYTDEDMSNEKSVPGPQIIPGTRKLPLEELVLIPGNEFSKSRTIFAGGTSLNVADTTRTGRVLGLDVFEGLIFSHDVGLSWDEKFDLSTIYVVDGVRAEIRAPYCEKFCEKAKFNDYFSYICNIVELEGVGRLFSPSW